MYLITDDRYSLSAYRDVYYIFFIPLESGENDHFIFIFVIWSL